MEGRCNYLHSHFSDEEIIVLRGTEIKLKSQSLEMAAPQFGLGSLLL